jgi:Leucine-rich repeat (LRR) protein
LFFTKKKKALKTREKETQAKQTLADSDLYNKKMNVYFSHMQQNIKHLDWSKVVGLSNYELNPRDTYHLHRLFLQENKLKVSSCLLQFYRKRNCIDVSFEMDIPIGCGSVYLENIQSVHFPKNLQGYENMVVLDLQCCNLSLFPWRQLPSKLRTLNLSHNFLSGHINLSHTNGLRFIYLSHNRIQSVHLPYDCNTADISHNKCTDIIFYNPLMHCDFSWNLLAEFCACKWIEKCNVSHNNIASIDFSHSKKLIDLNLSYNNISGEFNVANCLLLEKVNVSYNKITWIEGLESLPNIELLDASHNHLETVTIPKISRVNLQHNPLLFFEWLEKKKSGGFSITGILNGESHDVPMVNFVMNVLKSHLKADEIDKMYERDCGKPVDPKLFIDLSNTHLQEFSDVGEIKGQTCIHILLYNVDFVDIPFHPKVSIHILPDQAEKWEQQLSQENRIRFMQLVNQQFYVIDHVS